MGIKREGRVRQCRYIYIFRHFLGPFLAFFNIYFVLLLIIILIILIIIISRQLTQGYDNHLIIPNPGI